MALCDRGTDVRLHGYVDSYFAGDVDSRRSTTDYVFILESGAVSWVLRLQKIVVLFTTDAEYVAATKACKEMIWLKNFMKEIGKEQMSLPLYNDSQNAINLSNNLFYHDKIKHIDVRYYFIRILLKDSVLLLKKTHTSQNPADILTSVVTVEKLKIYLAYVGLQA